MRGGLLVVKGISRLTRLDWIHLSRSRNRLYLYTGLCPDLKRSHFPTLAQRSTKLTNFQEQLRIADYQFPPTELPQTTRHIMGWFSSSDTSKASDGGRIAPDRSSRERCWEGRDRFFACLDQNNILDAVKDDKEARGKCGKEVEEFEGACAKAWVCCAWRATVPCLRLFC